MEDFDGLAEVLLWPRVLAVSAELAHKDRAVLVKGRLDLSGDGARVSAEEIVHIDFVDFIQAGAAGHEVVHVRDGLDVDA